MLHAALQFEIIVQELLGGQGFHIRQPLQIDRDSGLDFVGIRGEEKWAVQVKYYRTERAQGVLLQQAAALLVEAGKLIQATSGMLVVSCTLLIEMPEALESRFSIRCVDRA